MFWKVFVPTVVAAIAGWAGLVYFSDGALESNPTLEGVIRAGDPDFQRYREQLEFEDRGVKMLKSFTGSRLVLFTGAVTNHGDRALDVIEVRLLLFNAHEQVFESVRTPIKPGYYTPAVLSGQSRGFTLYLEDFPDTWWASRAEMEISGLRLAGAGSQAR